MTDVDLELLAEGYGDPELNAAALEWAESCLSDYLIVLALIEDEPEW